MIRKVITQVLADNSVTSAKLNDNLICDLTTLGTGIDAANDLILLFDADQGALRKAPFGIVPANICGGTGVTYCSTTGEISIGQDVSITSNVEFCDITVTGRLLSDDVTASNVFICGNLTVTGTTTTVDSTTVNVADLNITLGCNATNATQADGGGINLSGANACIYYNSVNDLWSFNKNVCASTFYGQISDISNHTTTDLAEGTNLYYTNARSRLSLCGTGDITYCNTSGEINVTTYKSTDFDTDFSNKSTTDLAEGTNLYYTDAKARLALCGTGDITYCNTTGEINVTTYKNSDFDTDFSGKFTCDLAELNDLYYTDARVDTRLGTTSIDILCDVDISTTAPTCGQALLYDDASCKFLPGTVATGGGTSGGISLGLAIALG